MAWFVCNDYGCNLQYTYQFSTPIIHCVLLLLQLVAMLQGMYEKCNGITGKTHISFYITPVQNV